MQSSTEHIFLDVKIFVHFDYSLSTTLYRKEMAGNRILHSKNAHPPLFVQSIPMVFHLGCGCVFVLSKTHCIKHIFPQFLYFPGL